MKFFATLLALISGTAGMQAFAQTSDSQEYNLLSAGIDRQAKAARAVFALGAAEARHQAVVSKSQKSKVCFRLGALMERAIGSSARYELYAANEAQKTRGQRAMLLAVQASTYCGFKPEEVLNPEYTKITAGIKDIGEIGSVKNLRQLDEVVSEIEKLTTAK